MADLFYTKATMSGNNMYDGYEKLKTVGQGTYGTATLYRRLRDGKHVVMKEIFTMEMDDEEKKSALNEVEILSNLNHSNIIKNAVLYEDHLQLIAPNPNQNCRYLGNFEKGGSLIIIMEFADGGNLAQLINGKKKKNETFTERGVLHIIFQISAALSYMHKRKILHRDLKTANIFLSIKGTIKVGDFGISKMLNTRSQANTIVGTPYYLSPEMCEGSDYDEKSDVWAMGCILYELTTLRKPFEAPTLPVLVRRIIACEYEDIPEFFSDDLSQLIKSILQKKFTNRPTANYVNNIVISNILKKNNISVHHSNSLLDIR